MIKFKMKIAALVGAVGICLSALTTPLMAVSIGIGASGSGAHLDITGKETLKTASATTEHQREAVVFIPSAYLQLTIGEGRFGEYNGFVIGIEAIPGTAQLGSETRYKTDLLASDATNYYTNYAQAQLKNHNSIYIETPAFTGMGLFAKAAISEVTVETNETLGTGASYGNQDINGRTIGFGFKKTNDSGISLKLEYNYTNYDDISLSSTGSDAATTITADADRQDVKFSIGYNF